MGGRPPSRHRSHSRERAGGGSRGYYDRDAPQDRDRSRTPPPHGRLLSRDVIIEGLGGELKDDDVVTPLLPLKSAS